MSKKRLQKLWEAEVAAQNPKIPIAPFYVNREEARRGSFCHASPDGKHTWRDISRDQMQCDSCRRYANWRHTL